MSISSVIGHLFGIRSQHLQNKLNKAQLEQLEDEAKRRKKEAEPRACVETEVIKARNGENDRIRVLNFGNVEVHEVTMLVVNSDNLDMTIVENEAVFVYSCLPDESSKISFIGTLMPGMAFEISFKISGDSIRAFKTITEWENDFGNKEVRESLLIV